jgi:hypothetical protein
VIEAEAHDALMETFDELANEADVPNEENNEELAQLDETLNKDALVNDDDVAQIDCDANEADMVINEELAQLAEPIFTTLVDQEAVPNVDPVCCPIKRPEIPVDAVIKDELRLSKVNVSLEGL